MKKKKPPFNPVQLINWLLEVTTKEHAVTLCPDKVLGKTAWSMDNTNRLFKKENKKLNKQAYHINPWNHFNGGNPMKMFLKIDKDFLNDCVLTKSDERKFMTKEEFIFKSNLIYPDKQFDYSEVTELVVIPNK